MSAGQPSLFRRLFFGLLALMLAIWLAVLLIDMLETRTTAKALAMQETKGLTRNVLLFMQAVADRPEQMRQVARGMEKVRDDLFKERGLYPDRLRVQVWKGADIVYASMPELSTSLPSPQPGTGAPVGNWVAWVEHDRASDVTVRITQEVTGTWLIADFASVGYYLLPLLCSLPFVALPAWLVIRRGLRPLDAIVREIEGRAASDLSALAPSPYRELSPLVQSVNRLMQRLTERLEREQEFLQDAAHELKTPLAVVQINADSLIGAHDAARAREAGEGLRQGVARATHTVHQLLALARSGADCEHDAPHPTDLVELVGQRLAATEHLAWQRGIEIELQAPPACVLPLHRESMAALIDNVLGNAIKYSPAQRRVAVCIAVGDAGVQLVVADQGPGIPLGARAQVFERFFRLPGQDQPGSGLGLAIAQRAAQRNRASIALGAGIDGAGLSVTVTFTGA